MSRKKKYELKKIIEYLKYFSLNKTILRVYGSMVSTLLTTSFKLLSLSVFIF